MQEVAEYELVFATYAPELMFTAYTIMKIAPKRLELVLILSICTLLCPDTRHTQGPSHARRSSPQRDLVARNSRLHNSHLLFNGSTALQNDQSVPLLI